MATAPTQPAPGADPPLKRAISRNMLLLFVIGDVVGGGIYTLVGKVGGEVGGLVWLPMGIALALALLTATAYAELVTKYPQAAGAALYVNKAFKRPFFTFMIAFAVMCSGIASAATLARGVSGTYLPQLIGGIDGLTAVKLIGLGFLLIVAAINFRGISESVKVNVVLTLIELGVSSSSSSSRWRRSWTGRATSATRSRPAARTSACCRRRSRRRPSRSTP